MATSQHTLASDWSVAPMHKVTVMGVALTLRLDDTWLFLVLPLLSASNTLLGFSLHKMAQLPASFSNLDLCCFPQAPKMEVDKLPVQRRRGAAESSYSKDPYMIFNPSVAPSHAPFSLDHRGISIARNSSMKRTIRYTRPPVTSNDAR